MSSLKGKVALVTEVSRGIGKAIADRQGSNGTSIAITCNRKKRKHRSLICKALEWTRSLFNLILVINDVHLLICWRFTNHFLI